MVDQSIPKERRKVTKLLNIEAQVQKVWDEKKPFELDAPEDESSTQEKFLVTFPFPYQNGRLHVGHIFTLSKAEFAVGFERMRGKRALFPFGFHATGMPIKACADKLKAEIAQYGNPPNFPDDDAVEIVEEPEIVKNKAKSKKSKAVAKAGSSKFQWNIMKGLGLSDEEIPKFADDNYWLDYFPDYSIKDLKLMGLKADFRRSFLTTERNLYFDSFVQWQFRQLKAKGLIDFGKRYSIYSPKDGQPCMDHDRSSGEGVGPQEYTLIKIRVLSNLPKELEAAGKPVYLVIATLDPETMRGQTDCFINPDLSYAAFYVGPNNEEIYVATKRTARNMSYQGFTKETEKIEYVVEDVKGSALIGAKLKVPLTSDDLNQAVKYMEPEKLVMSRSGDECVVALCDQWYLDYGNEDWKAKARKVVDQMETYGDECRRNLLRTIDWLHEYACSRLYGLGTKLPWDKRWVIESLSDSTIYPCYYSVAYILQKGSLDGKDTKNGVQDVKPEQLNDAFWDFVLLDNTAYDSSKINVPKEIADKCKKEFNYWRAPNMRVSGKDLIQNHLTFYVFNHVAIFGDNTDKWPKGIRVNGHLLLDNEKMSKSTGNFLTLSETIDTYSADGMRLALADAGDYVEGANFARTVASSGLLRLFNMVEYAKEMIENHKAGNYRTGEKTSLDKYFVNRLNVLGAQAYEAYEKTEYKNALKYALYEYQAARDTYRELCGGETQMHADLVDFHTNTQFLILSPICPHICEHVWHLLGKNELIVNEKWPVFETVDQNLLKEFEFINAAIHEFRQKHQITLKPKKGAAPSPPTRGIIYVASQYPPWQAEILQLLSDLTASDSSFPDMREISGKLKESEVLKKVQKKVMPFVSGIKVKYEQNGSSAFQNESPIEQWKILKSFREYIRQALNLTTLEMVGIEESAELPEQIIDKCAPLRPLIIFEA